MIRDRGSGFQELNGDDGFVHFLVFVGLDKDLNSWQLSCAVVNGKVLDFVGKVRLLTYIVPLCLDIILNFMNFRL